MKLAHLKDHVPEQILEIFTSRGVDELFPPQADAFEKGLFQTDSSFVIAAPTASGKTLIAECVLGRILFERKGVCVYLVPLDQLLKERYEELKPLRKHGVNLYYKWGGPLEIGTPSLLITTPESFQANLNRRPEWLAYLDCLVVDEIHILGDASRGPTLESIIALVKSVKPETQIIGLSATIDNYQQLASWLEDDAGTVFSDFRPVKLECEILVSIDRAKLAIETASQSVLKGEPVLLFKRNKAESESLACRLAEALEGKTVPLDQSVLDGMADDIIPREEENVTEVDRLLARCLRRGVGFHHAMIRNFQKGRIIREFREGNILAICATPTLAMGVNTPAKTVIVVEPQIGMMPLPVNLFHQMAGRAGRPGYWDVGRIILIARSDEEEQRLREKYIEGGFEAISSHFNPRTADVFRQKVLGVIASGLLPKRPQLLDFLNNTFFAIQNRVRLERLPPAFLGSHSLMRKAGAYDLSHELDVSLEWLGGNGLVKGDEELELTELGRVAVTNGLLPETVLLLKDDFVPKLGTADLFSLLYTLAATWPNTQQVIPRRFTQLIRKKLSATLHNFGLSIAPEKVTGIELTTVVLYAWSQGESEAALEADLDVYGGSMSAASQSFVRLMDIVLKESEAFGLDDDSRNRLARVRLRIQYGIPENAVSFVQIEGVGRVTAMTLASGYGDLEALAEIEREDLAEVLMNPSASEPRRIGMMLAKRIIEFSQKSESALSITADSPQSLEEAVLFLETQEQVEPSDLLDNLVKHVETLPIFRDHKDLIMESIESFRKTKHKVALNGLINALEGSLRDFLVEKTERGRADGLPACTNGLRSEKWISPDTAALILGLQREKIDHALEGEHKEFPRLFCQLALLALLKVARDWIYFAAVREAFNFVLDREEFRENYNMERLLVEHGKRRKIHSVRRWRKDYLEFDLTFYESKVHRFRVEAPLWEIVTEI